jgi:hypothetical protein
VTLLPELQLGVAVCVRCRSKTLLCATADERYCHGHACFPPIIAVDTMSAIFSGSALFSSEVLALLF